MGERRWKDRGRPGHSPRVQWPGLCRGFGPALRPCVPSSGRRWPRRVTTVALWGAQSALRGHEGLGTRSPIDRGSPSKMETVGDAATALPHPPRLCPLVSAGPRLMERTVFGGVDGTFFQVFFFGRKTGKFNRRRLQSNRRRLGPCLRVPESWAGDWAQRPLSLTAFLWPHCAAPPEGALPCGWGGAHRGVARS